MSALTISFTAGLAYNFPALLPCLKEHLNDNFSDILPHILIADYCRLISKTARMQKWHKDFFDYLENNFMESEDEISGLIAVSFIENLPYETSPTHWSIHILKGKMELEYIRIYGPIL
jgi:hypothetical protein